MKHFTSISFYIFMQICILSQTIITADTSCKEPSAEAYTPLVLNNRKLPHHYHFFTGKYKLAKEEEWTKDSFDIPSPSTDCVLSAQRYTSRTGEYIDEYDPRNRQYFARIVYPQILQSIIILRRNPRSIIVQYPNNTKVKIMTKNISRREGHLAAGSQIMLQSPTNVLTHHYTAGTRDPTGLIYGDGTQETIYPDQSRKIIFGAGSHNPKDFTLGAGTIAYFYRNGTTSLHFAPGTGNKFGEPIPYTQQIFYKNGKCEVFFPSGKKILRHPNGDTTYYETNGEITIIKRRD